MYKNTLESINADSSVFFMRPRRLMMWDLIIRRGAEAVI